MNCSFNVSPCLTAVILRLHTYKSDLIFYMETLKTGFATFLFLFKCYFFMKCFNQMRQKNLFFSVLNFLKKFNKRFLLLLSTLLTRRWADSWVRTRGDPSQARGGRAASWSWWWSRTGRAAGTGPRRSPGSRRSSPAGCGRSGRSAQTRWRRWRRCEWLLPTRLLHLWVEGVEDTRPERTEQLFKTVSLQIVTVQGCLRELFSDSLLSVSNTAASVSTMMMDWSCF